MSDMRIAIFGANGFIGRRLSRLAREMGHETLLFDLPDADVRRPETFSAKLKEFKPDSVINLAALLGTRLSVPYTMVEMFETNVIGNLNVIEAAKSAGAHNFIFTSSITVHGHNELGKHQERYSHFSPEHSYSASKAAAEYSLMQFAKINPQMSIVALRPTMVIGEDSPIAHAPIDFVRSAAQGKDIELFGDGNHEREWVWVDDAARGVLQGAIHAPEFSPGYHPFFITGNRISMKELAEKVAREFGVKLKYVPKTIQTFTLTSDPSDSHRLIEWKAKISIDDMLAELSKTFKKN